MNTHLSAMTCVAALAWTLPAGAADGLDLDFDDGVGTWRIVVDGVMGGLSSGRVSISEPGVMRFGGDLSLENNGGFSQVRRSVDGSQLADADGITVRIRGDGRTYKFDIRCSDVRMMAGGYQQDFETTDGTWSTVRLSFDDFRLYSFGRLVSGAPPLTPANIESIGFTLSDKQPGPFRLEVDSIVAFGEDLAGSGSSGRDLVTVARAAGLDTLLELVTAAELDVPRDQRLTIFAPTNAAFAQIPERTRRALVAPEGRETLRSILAHHVATPALSSSDLLSRRSIDMLGGQRLDVSASGRIGIGGAGIIATDVPFDGGVVHVIDTVLMPESRSIVDIASATDDLSTLSAALASAGLGDQLGAENGPWTVFAPIDSAFAALPDGTLASLTRPENRRQLVEILGLHVVPGRIYASDLLATGQTRTLLGEPVEFGLDEGRLRVGATRVVRSDIEARNGVIHLIDGVLLPTSDASGEPSMTAKARGTEIMRIFALAIERGAPLFNEGQPAACAAVYEVAIEAALALGGLEPGSFVQRRLDLARAEGEAERSPTDRAWTYRRAMDDVFEALQKQGVTATATR